MLREVFCDWFANRGRPHVQILLAMFRASVYVRNNRRLLVRLFAPLCSSVYRAYALGVVSVDIPVSTSIGRDLVIHHGFGVVVNPMSVLGAGITLRQGVTIGVKVSGGKAPVIGDRVDFGSAAQVLGDVNIGHATIVGAGAIVLRSAEPNSILVGNPARVVGSTSKPEEAAG